jgi:hypothetical protein
VYAPAMIDLARSLKAEVSTACERFAAITDKQAGAPREGGGGWSRKEILGHLLDSAANNHQRFVRLIHADRLAFPSYEQERWVAAQAYGEREWGELVELWSAYNRHIAHVIARLPENALDHVWERDQPLTLKAIAEDYLRHLRHHVAQIVS